MPKRVKMKIKRNNTIENVPTSLRVLAIVLSNISNLFHVFANLNTRRSLKARKAVITDPALLFSEVSLTIISEITISTRLPITIKVSKMLNHWP